MKTYLRELILAENWIIYPNLPAQPNIIYPNLPAQPIIYGECFICHGKENIIFVTVTSLDYCNYYFFRCPICKSKYRECWKMNSAYNYEFSHMAILESGDI